jgi:acetyl esterase/lipase
MPKTRFMLAAIGVLAFLALSLPAAEQTATEREKRRRELISQFDRDNDGTLNQEERRALLEHLQRRRNSQSQPASQPTTAAVAELLKIPPGVKLIKDVEYARVDDRPLLLDVHLPEKAPSPLPVIVWVHGGAWVSGSKEPCQIVSFSGKGYAIVGMDYRLTSQAQFPVQINDCKAVVRWVRANAAKYGFDPDRIGAAGGSAGGHLVALLGTSGDVKELEGDVGGNLTYSSRVKAVADFCGPTDFTREDSVRDASKNEPAILEVALTRLLGGPWKEKREAANTASPVYHISKDDPPFLIVHGDADNIIPVKHSQILHDKLKEAGLDVTLHIVKGGGHGVGAYPGVLDKTLAFFDRQLKKPAGTHPAGRE